MKCLYFFIALLSQIVLSQPVSSQSILEEKLSRMKSFHMFTPENLNDNHAGECLLDKYCILDTSRLQVVYDVVALCDTLQHAYNEDRAILQVGTLWMKFYGQTKWRLDNNYTLLTSGKPQVSYDDLKKVVIDYSVFRNLNTGTLINQHYVPFMSNYVIIYDERIPAFEWDISPDIRQIAGYDCQHATTCYKGRTWGVWFTASIPINCGLWKFDGLPGLILEAVDSQNHYRFVAREIIQEKAPILFFEIPSKKMERKDWRKFEKRLRDSPVDFFGTNEGFVLTDPGKGGMNLLDESWHMPYNPLELE